MIIVDNALKARAEQGKPIKVAILGGGFMAQGLTYQIVNSVPAMSMVAIYSRKPQKGHPCAELQPGWNSESIFDHDMRGTSP
jgi:predicted homoserine dehydrogenase-like protein